MEVINARAVKAIRALPGVVSVAPLPGAEAPTLALKLQGDKRRHVLRVVELSSNLSTTTGEMLLSQLAGGRKQASPPLVIVPHMSAAMGQRFAKAGVWYLDRSGNCHLSLGALHLHVEGRSVRSQAHLGEEPPLRSHPTPKVAALRRPGYQVLFAYLAQPSLLEAPLRQVAAAAGVSRQAVMSVRHRLLQTGYIAETKSKTVWLPRRAEAGLQLWLGGYENTVRPSLLLGRYSVAVTEPAEVMDHVALALGNPNQPAHAWRWGGSTAAHQLTAHYRGPMVTVHVADATWAAQRLRARPHAEGPLLLLGNFGELNQAPDGQVVDPLLIHAEMLQEGSERAREAANEVYERYILPRWSQP